MSMVSKQVPLHCLFRLQKVNVKSIMGMMSLAMNYEDMVTVVTEGKDEKEALDTLEQFLSEG